MTETVPNEQAGDAVEHENPTDAPEGGPGTEPAADAPTSPSKPDNSTARAVVQAVLHTRLEGRTMDAQAAFGLDPDQFIDADGNANLDAITEWVKENSHPKPGANLLPGDFSPGQGISGRSISTVDWKTAIHGD